MGGLLFFLDQKTVLPKINLENAEDEIRTFEEEQVK
jgi:hypothetical protein